jgi:hypothetical protein
MSSAGAICMLIEYVETDDLEDGSPVVPGFVDDGIHWSRVARLPNERTRWRRISLAEIRAIDHRQIARKFTIGGNGKAKRR